ncbi:putative sphingolipid transporter spinster-like protein 1 [Diplonema papillatum]|nr:putative sphingolipid transporter spinster-like protein 1 [Diplonema papillatum]
MRFKSNRMVLVLFCLVQTMNFVERGIVNSSAIKGNFIDAPCSEECPDPQSLACRRLCGYTGVQGEFELTNSQMGSLASIFMAGLALASPPSAHAAKYCHPFLAIGVGQLVFSLALLAAGFAPNFPTLLAARAVVGASEPAFIAVAPAIIDLIAPDDRRGIWLSLFVMCVSLGTGLGLGIGYAFAESGLEWRWAFRVQAMAGLPVALFFLMTNRPEAYTWEQLKAASPDPRPVSQEELDTRHHSGSVGALTNPIAGSKYSYGTVAPPRSSADSQGQLGEQRYSQRNPGSDDASNEVDDLSASKKAPESLASDGRRKSRNRRSTLFSEALGQSYESLTLSAFEISAPTPLSLFADVKALLRSAPYVFLVLGHAACLASAGVVQFWGPKAAQGHFHMSEPRSLHVNVDAYFSGLVIATGILGTLAGGYVLDRYVCGSYSSACVLAAVQLTLSGGFFLASFWLLADEPHPVLFFALFAMGNLMLASWFTPAINALLWVCDPGLRVQSIGLATFIYHFLGDIPSPYYTGVIQDHTHDWQLTMTIILPFFFLSSLCFVVASAIQGPDDDEF